MLKEYTHQIYRLWFVIDSTIAAGLFLAFTSQPALQRIDFPIDPNPASMLFLATMVGLSSASLMGAFGLYGSQRSWGISERVTRLLAAQGLFGLILSTIAFTLDAPVDRIFPIVFAGSLLVLQGGTRLVGFAGLSLVRRSGSNYRNVLIVGAGPLAASARSRILLHPAWGLRIVGFVDDGEGEGGFVPSVPTDDIHKFVDLPMLLRNESIDEVMVACPRAMIATLEPVVRECAMIGVPVILLSDFFGDVLPPPRVGRFDTLSTLRFAPVHHGRLELLVKRSMDIVGALIGLILMAPIMLVAAIAIRLDGSGPVFFRQTRAGLNGRRFEMLKLRTMVPNAEALKADLLDANEMDGPVFKIKADPRVTPAGRILRSFSIDELPQLWNVLRGDMSLVGPRPPTPDEVLQYAGSDRRRLSVRPGLTCLWQISGRNEVSFEEWMALDLMYIDEWSLATDLRILFATIPSVLTRRGAS
jgi:exopolysaccharide biosynthesis polyprenyl glycosylphosphotransferase